MNGFERCAFSALALAIGVAAAGCTGADPADSPPVTEDGGSSLGSSSVRPTLTDARLQPPSQDNKYTKAGGRPAVVVDPCTWIPDETIHAIDLDPATRQRGRDLVAEYTFLTCDFAAPTGGEKWRLQVDSGNVSLDEVRQKYAGRTENVDINGREAVRTVKNGEKTCAVDLRTSVGYFGVEAAYAAIPGADTAAPCDKAMEYARALEPVIGTGN
ncbi:DUF3558 family protein [Nocardia sp. AG03]|uniref:DUF3558 family protein n=1 Tax=Nocardia sp. AG03 TaxID=3025312 RepID=UPI0024186B8A|nr:DUF3558 family protein [Nocardia sp. AG03]